MQINKSVLVRTEMSLCDLVYEGEHCSSLYPHPPEEARRYWIKSHRTTKSQFGAGFLNHKQQEEEFLILIQFPL